MSIMALSTSEVIIFFLLVILGSIIVAWVIGRIQRATVVRKEEREATQIGKVYGRARERIVEKE